MATSSNADPEDELQFTLPLDPAVPRTFICSSCGKPCKTSRGLKVHIGSKACITQTVRNSQQNGTQMTLPAASMFNFSALEVLLESLKSVRCVPIMRRIPKSSRRLVAQFLTGIIESCTRENSLSSWSKVFCFASHVLALPAGRPDRSKSLTSLVKRQLASFDGRPVIHISSSRKATKSDAEEDLLKRRVEARLSEGDITGAVRILSSEETVAFYNSVTLASLRSKHPNAPTVSSYPEAPDFAFELDEVKPDEVFAALKSFLMALLLEVMVSDHNTSRV